ncbi:hypothetical protein VUR80DRAFT_5744 [Thermomyces stellatus]
MRFIDGPVSAVSYFAANAKSPSLRKKMQALALPNMASSSCSFAPTQMAETSLRRLVHTDSRPTSYKNYQSSKEDSTVPPFLDLDGSRSGAFSEFGVRQKMLLPGKWPLSRVSSQDPEAMGSELDQGLVPRLGAIEPHMTGWAYQQSNNDSRESYIYTGGVSAHPDMLGAMQVQDCGSVPGYFGDYHNRLLAKDDDNWRRSLAMSSLASPGC